jgi:hypothetical protein
MASNNTTLLSDHTSLGANKLLDAFSPQCEISQQNCNEMHDSLDHIFASMQTYRMEYDVESVRF